MFDVYLNGRRDLLVVRRGFLSLLATHQADGASRRDG